MLTAAAIAKVAPAAKPYADELAADNLRAALSYDPETGGFRWKPRPNLGRQVGSLAGTTDKDGYRVIQVGMKIFKAHRLAWLFTHGCWPPEQIDHRNGRRDDNRIANLRLASPGENNQNTAVYKSNNTGYTGVVWHKRQRKYIATIKRDRVRYHLGCYLTAEEAAEAYRAAKAKIHEFQPVSRAA